MSAFEIITEDEYKASRSDRVEGVGVDNSGSSADDTEPTPTEVWCDFCKGHFIEEYHVERWEGVKST